MTYQVKYNNDEFEFEYDNEEYRCSVHAKADWYHEDTVYYYKDGSGYPGDNSIEITGIVIKQLEKRGDHGWESVSITDAIECAVTDELYDMDLDEWSDTDTCEESEPEPEPPYDWVVRDKEPL